ncbi:MAG: Fis family transcriptional regulator [Candidatus Rokuibacteriota bacterium]|nr:MAG: Fis family transcriptional regulator [Candidatus Rokubacteria bacterium]
MWYSRARAGTPPGASSGGSLAERSVSASDRRFSQHQGCDQLEHKVIPAMTASILVVDDEPAIQDILTWALSAEGYRVATAGSGEEALARVEEEDFDVIVTDIVMPGLDGLEVLERSRVLSPRAAVIVMTAYAALDTAITALRRGASDYLEKPFSVDLLKERVQRLLQYRETLWKDRLVQRAMQPRPAGSLVGESDAIRALHEQIMLAARTPSNVLITGESGVGKELVARGVHAEGARHDAAFVAINCGAIPEALLESQLFGHVRGAFTTAVQANQGLFVAANQGTLFLDEIGEMPLPLQVKLLRVIEDKSVLPVGGTKPLPVDTRIIASTNRDLEREVEAGRFREDLFYRLNVVHLAVPPLRERRGDIPVLVDHLVHRLNAKLGTHCLGVERAALWSLIGRPWKGNVRELENVLERAIVLGGNDLISMRDLSAEPATGQGAPPQNLRGAVRRFERQHLMEVLAATQSDKRKAARVLGISLASLYRKIRGEDDEPGPDSERT